MPRYSYERLSALDNSFLLLERPNAHMHVASTAIHEMGPLRTVDGGVDVELIRRGVAGVLHRLPRYRQKLAWVPLEHSPVWIDDDGFSLDYHIRHTSLPRPGDEEQLQKLAARIQAQPLDRARPLWELWIVEGLEDERFAVISKVHHCMIDGVAGVDLMNVLMSPDPDAEILEAPPFVPRPAPSPVELVRDELIRRLRLPFEAVRDFGKLIGAAEDTRRDVLVRARAVVEALGASLRPASPTPLNQPIGPHRRHAWWTLDLADVKRIRRTFGGSINDVVLAIVTGAVHRFLTYRRVDPSELDFRVMAPVSVRDDSERGRIGNRVSAWFVPLPLDEPDPREQLRILSDRTAELRASKSAVAAQVLTQVAEWTPATLLSLGARNATRLQPFNLVVTNVPGPQVPLYLLGGRMLEIYPAVPLVEGLGLGIALFSYDGRLHWGLNADYELVPDLERFITFAQEAAAELLEAANAEETTKRRASQVENASPDGNGAHRIH